MTQDQPAKKSHHYQGPKRTALRCAERAEMYFIIYADMGVERSLNKLWGRLRGYGVSISLKSLEKYSRQFNWQARILERAARHESTEFQEVQTVVDEMNNRHANLFKDLASVAKAGLNYHKEKIKDQLAAGLGETLPVELPDLARILESAERGERLARGLATSKAEVLIEILAPLVKDMFAVFLSVNVITKDTPDIVKQREAEFIKRGDQVLHLYYDSTGKQAAVVKREQ
jgi:hypothetical protein